MPLTDFHSHCLPQMDDGAVDTAESLEMMRQTLAQGIETVAATSHFYAGQESISDFLARREAARQQLAEAIAATPELSGRIRLLMGAEVLLREGIHHLDLRPLCLEGTDCILLEMPFSPRPSWLYETIESIVFDQHLRVMLAHVDRYIPWYSTEDIAELIELPDTIVQLNGGSLQSRHDVRFVGRWLPPVNALVLGSDMHHTKERKQNLEAAVDGIRKNRRHREWLELIQHTGDPLLQAAKA